MRCRDARRTRPRNTVATKIDSSDDIQNLSHCLYYIVVEFVVEFDTKVELLVNVDIWMEFCIGLDAEFIKKSMSTW